MKLSFSKVPKYLSALLSPKCWYLIFWVTNVCNQRCRMCFNRDMDKPAEDILSIEEIRKIASGFQGLFQLTLSGGEPILRQDLPEIVRAFCARSAVPRITLPSNGQIPGLLEDVTRRILAENPGSNINVALSLDGIGEHHDGIRGVPGAFHNFRESMERMIRLKEKFPNLTLVVASTISAFNQDRTGEILDYIAKSPEPRMFGMMMARGLTREPGASQIDREKFLADLKKLHELQRSGGSRFDRAWNEVCFQNRVETIRSRRMADPCRAGSKLLVLTHNGFLWPCEPLQSSTHEGVKEFEGGFCFGNVRDAGYDICQLLASEHGKRIRRFIKDRKCACTFECALLNNFALNPANYLKALKRFL